MDITGIVLILILLVPTLIGILEGDLIWDGSQFTLKEEKNSRGAGLKKFNDSYIIS